MDTTHPPASTAHELGPAWLRWLLRALALAALALVFGMYLQPAFMVRLGDFIWSCFA